MKKQYINFLKIISILFVINIHLLSKAWNQSIPSTLNFKLLTFIDISFLVCVPIFAMCSGNIFLNRNDSTKKIIFKYALKIYLVFIFFTTLYKVADIIFYQNNVLSFNILIRIIKDAILLRSIYHLWYLRIVLVMYLSIPLIKLLFTINNKYMDHIILVLIILIVKVLPTFINIGWFITFISVFGFIIYFYLGYYLDKYFNKELVLILLPIAIFSYYYTYIRTIHSSIATGIPTVDHMQYLSYNILFISIFIFLVVRWIKNIFDNKNLAKYLNFLTKYNFYVYLFHGFIIGLITKFKIINIYQYNHVCLIYIYGIISYIATLICVIPIKTVIDKIKVVNKN